MKILFYTDPHWSQYSSILRSRGTFFSTRLENLIYSINWAEEQAGYYGCNAIIIGGDFFDSSYLNAEEISALQHIRWAPVSHVFLAGNHETNVSNLEYNTADLFKLCQNSVVISTPEHYTIADTSCEFCFLPYVLERDRKSLIEYFGPKPNDKHRIIFSHNDLKDVNYGNFVSPEGFELADIDANSDLFINGHIHHYSRVNSKVINGGNLTGQNFTEDNSYRHGVIILDTETLEYQFIDNPYAIHFEKLDYSGIKNIHTIFNKLSSITKPSVLTIKVREEFVPEVKNYLRDTSHMHLFEYRIIASRELAEEIIEKVDFKEIDHIKQFQSYVLAKIGDSQAIKDELAALFT